MNIRIKALIACIVELFLFSFISFFLFIAFFKLAFFSFPFSAFIWTYWGFNVFTLIFGVKVLERYKASYAFLNFFAVGILIIALIAGFGAEINIWYIIIAASIVAVLYILLSVHFIKTYWRLVAEEVLRWFGKNSQTEKKSDDSMCGN